MSQFPSQLQVCVMKKSCASGNILLECYPLLWRRAIFHLNVTRCYDVAQNAATSAIGFSIWTVRASFSRSQHFSECYPPLHILRKNGVTCKNFKQTTDQWNYRKLAWGIKNTNAYTIKLQKRQPAKKNQNNNKAKDTNIQTSILRIGQLYYMHLLFYPLNIVINEVNGE